MKHFRPELLVRFASPNDKEADVAADRWEAESAIYARYLEGVRLQLPPEFNRLLEGYYLHDAKVEFAGRPDRDFLIVLTPDAPPRDSLLLNYELIAEPAVIRHKTNSLDDAPVEWLYDEVEVRTGKSRWLRRPRRAFRHSILLSSGLELQIDFDNFRLSRVPNEQVPVTGGSGCLVSDSRRGRA